jgi:hypothetical protein
MKVGVVAQGRVAAEFSRERMWSSGILRVGVVGARARKPESATRVAVV